MSVSYFATSEHTQPAQGRRGLESCRAAYSRRQKIGCIFGFSPTFQEEQEALGRPNIAMYC